MMYFVNLPITYKSKKSTSKYQKMPETKKIRLDTFKCYFFFTKKTHF